MSAIFNGLLKCVVSPICLTIATLGAGLLALGFLGKTALGLFLPQVLALISSVANTTALQNSIDSGSESFFEVSKYAGGVVAAIGVLGVVAACTGSSTLLRLFGLLAILIAGILLIIVYQFTSGSAETQIRGSLKDTITNYYQDLLSKDLYTLVWTAVMLLFKCCGVDNFGDFNNTLHWNRTLHFNYSGYTKDIYQISPLACCKNNASLPELPDFSSIGAVVGSVTKLPEFASKLISSLDPKIFADLNPECAEAPSTANSNYLQGCWAVTTAKLSTLLEILKYIMYVLVGLPMAVGIIAIGASFKPDGKKGEKKE